MDIIIKFFAAIFKAFSKKETPKIEPVETPKANPEPTKEDPEQEKKKAPWYLTMLSWKGKGESDSVFVKYMSSFWSKVGLGYTTIVGSKYAWCGLGMAAALIVNGLPYQKDGAGARNWDKYGQAIEWKKNGIPQGAIMHLNHAGNCNSSKYNHVTMANGDCTADDLLKKNATIDGLGANQGDKVKVSTYGVFEICSVRWPSVDSLPAKVTKSVNCTSNGKSGESTQ